MKYSATFALVCLITACQGTQSNLSPLNPSTIPEAATSSPTTNPAAMSSEDQAFKIELGALLKQMEPGIQENKRVSELTLEHAQALIEDPNQSSFNLKSLYQPVAQSNLETRLLQEGLFFTDNLVSAYLSDGNQEQARQRFVKQVQEIIGTTPFTHYGLAVMRKGQAWYISLILLTELIELKGVSLELAQPRIQTYTGTLTHEGYSSPDMLVTRPDGKVEEIKIKTMNTSQFQAEINFDQKGLYSVEVNLKGPLGALPATNFIVAVGTDYPRDSGIPPEQEKIASLYAAQNKMLALLNHDRTSLGLSSLKLDTVLSQAAQAHCEDMLKNKFIGHNSPSIGTPQQQAAQFSVTDLVAQNIAISRNLSNAQIELMSSPGHRKTILDPLHTHVGFGVTAGDNGFLYLTQTFIHRVLEIEPIPAEISAGQALIIKGKSTQAGSVAVYLDQEIQGTYQEVDAGGSFRLPVSLKQPGKQRLRIGFAPPAGSDANLNFTFYNIWEILVM